ncbi:hypothetical protein SAMN06265379_101523 [Saccharicrinis carchari]|uniref:Wadjet protein JetD C-terminal domain-containing protein n=1 Tax=Saccharicrinis carchari TaxID=1168039 RepID=A0A521AYE9_SACCC|nr:hypothetical protein [Saccharicrinis carchari]SMO39781.1 hypothetical protein SAMN06265379_101523 [Saccharicrinis carchari]
MEKISLNIAKRIQLLIQGESIPHGQLKAKVIDQMLEEGILHLKLQGRSRKTVFATNAGAIANFLSSHLGINDLNNYIANLEHGTSRSENIVASSDSKSSARRTFKGFLVNCFSPVKTKMNGQDFLIKPQEGAYTYIHDFETFTIPPDTLIVGVENPENFRFIRKQAKLFNAESILFVSRYPQSNDLITWLQGIPNSYLHFGDFDFEGIRIFKDEYYQYLQSRASFFIPENIEVLIRTYGNKALYDKQYKTNTTETLGFNAALQELIALYHRYKKCLEQEVLIQVNSTH